MFVWISALLSVFLSLGGPGVAPESVVGTARTSGPVYLNGTKISQTALVVAGDRLETGPGGLAALNISSTDRVILGERSTVQFAQAEGGIAAEVVMGRLQVNTAHQRLHEVRLLDEGI